MRPEYDFSGAVRGKYYKRYLESTNVVVIEPDVHERFKNSAAVNEALRTLIRAAGKGRGLTKRRAPAAANVGPASPDSHLWEVAWNPQWLVRE